MKTLQPFQKEFFDFCVEQHLRRKKTELTPKEVEKLTDWILKDYEIDFKMVSVRTGKVMEGREKYSIMCVENMGHLENILDW